MIPVRARLHATEVGLARMMTPSKAPRTMRSVLLFLTATILASSCTADLDESCEDGTCTTAASSGAGGAAPFVCKYPDASAGLPCDVFTILVDNCQSCHNAPPANGAPFPLLTYDDTQAIYSKEIKRWERMALVVEPNGSPRMPFNLPPLLPNELNALRDWFATCRAGECARGPEGQPTTSSTSSSSASSGSSGSSSSSGL